MNDPNSATRLGAAVRSFAFAGATEKTIRMPAAWACGSQAAMSASPGIVVGLDAFQLIETRFTFSPMSLSVAKYDAPLSPFAFPASSVTPTSSAARAAPVTTLATSAQAHSSKPLFELKLILLGLGPARSQTRSLRSSARKKKLLSRRGSHPAAALHRT